jgi:hypothetical protein
VSSFEDRLSVPGIILSASKHVLRTDGLIVEALLGAGEGLDEYSQGLQFEQLRAKELANDRLQAKLARGFLAHKIASEGDSEGAELFEQAFHKTGLSTP